MQIDRLSARDFEEAIDFINMVFSMAYCPFDFVKFLPRLYRPTEEYMNMNLVVRENGRIRALVGLYPDVIQVGDTTLKIGGIGAVSCHPNDRGKGWMKLLMDLQIEEMLQNGFDLSFLVGQRQRYMYYGYEKTGMMLEYKLTKSNLKHDKYSQEIPVRLEPLEVSDLQNIGKAKELHDRQPIHCLRPIADFYLYLQTGYSQPWGAFDLHGNLIGYLTSNPDRNRITEIFATDETVMSGMVRAWFNQQSIPETTVVLPPWQGSTRYLCSLAENVQVTYSGNWRIFNWQKVVDTLLRIKFAGHSLVTGTVRIGIREYGILKIIVTNDKVTCEQTSERADVDWDTFTAMRILFGHSPASLVAAIPKSVEAHMASWFPLPLGWLPQNHV